MNHKFNPIAIIGYAGRFPGATNMDELLDLLMAGRDEVGSISEKRLKETTLPLDKEYMVGGFLTDIDKFDYKFFNYAPIEAMSMDPHIRFAIENTYHCLEDSGYGPDFFKGSNTMVIAAASKLHYYEHADGFDPTLVTGNDLPFLSATISRQFALRGLSAVTNSSCSSGLSAIQMACDALNMGRSEHAVVLSSNIILFPEKISAGLGLESKEGKSKSFSSKADGMSNGEASIAVLLKPLHKAIEDNDNIHGVIRAIGSNNDADLSASLTSPEYVSQSNLLNEVWEMADINPRDIRFIEAHGSGTQLGDSMEVLALNTSFKNYTKDLHFCSLSTIKTNIGHSKNASGLAGLAKVILSVKKAKLFPHLHFEEKSPLIDFENSAVKVQTKLEDWNTTTATKRIAGLTCMGLSGTNFHAIIEEAPSRMLQQDSWKGNFLIAISAASEEGLIRKLKQMEQLILEDIEMADIASTLMSGREHFKFRKIGFVKNKEDLKNFISNCYSNLNGIKKNKQKLKLVFLAVQTGLNDKKNINYFKSHYPEYNKNFEQCLNLAIEKENPFVIELAAQYNFFNMLKKAGITTDAIVAIGTGDLLLKVINNTITLKEALDQAGRASQLLIEQVEMRTQAMLNREKANGAPMFVDLGIFSSISDQLYVLNKSDDSFIIGNDPGHQDPFLQLLAKWYELGEDLNWQFVSNLFKGKRISLPLYPFEKTRCWIRETPRENNDAVITENEKGDSLLKNVGELELSILSLWKKVLGCRIESLDDNFFDLGGNSLKASKVIISLNELYNADLSFEDIFEFQTLAQLANYIKSQVGIVYRLKMLWKKVLKLEDINEGDNFFDLGGHSLLANNLINSIHNEFKIKLNFEDIFRSSVLLELAEHIEKIIHNGTETFNRIEKITEQNDYPLSTYQENLLSLCYLDPAISIAYNEQMTFQLNGKLDQNVLARSFKSLLQRHEILRTVLKKTKEGVVRQHVKTVEEYNFEMRYEDNSHLDTKVPDSYLEDKIAAFSAESFDLLDGPLLKALLIKTDDKKYLFSLVIHSLITDGWSKGIIMKEFLGLYSSYIARNDNPLVPLRIQYRDCVAWQLEKEKTLKHHKEYWLKQLEGELIVATFPLDKIRPKIKTYRGNVVSIEINTKLTKGLIKISSQEEATMFMTLITIINTALFKYTDQKDLIIGIPISNRNHRDLEDQIGAYANTLALRTRFNKDITYRELLNQVKKVTLDAYTYQEYPFDELVNALSLTETISHKDLFNVMVILHNTESFIVDDLQKIGDLDIEGYGNKKRVNTKHDLVFDFFELEDKLKMVISYNSDLYEPSTIDYLIDYIDNLIANITEDANKSICFLPAPHLVFDKINNH